MVPSYASPQVRPEEWEARELLRSKGFAFDHNVKGTKRPRRSDTASRTIVPEDGCMVFPRWAFALDADGPTGTAWLCELLQQEDETLVLGGRRGPHAVFLCPPLLQPRNRRIQPDLDVINRRLVLPGSLVNGHYYKVKHNPGAIAQISPEGLEWVLDRVGRATTPRTFVVENWDRYTTDARAAAAHRPAATVTPAGSTRTPATDMMPKILAAAHLAIDGNRHNHINSVAKTLLLNGQDFESFVQHVMAIPALAGKVAEKGSRGEIWLNERFTYAKTQLGHRSGTMESTPAGWRDVYGDPEFAAHWRARALAALTAPHQRRTWTRNGQVLLMVIELHANWVRAFGATHFLSTRQIRAYTGATHKTFDRASVELEALGVLKRHPYRAEFAAECWTALIPQTDPLPMGGAGVPLTDSHEGTGLGQADRPLVPWTPMTDAAIESLMGSARAISKSEDGRRAQRPEPEWSPSNATT